MTELARIQTGGDLDRPTHGPGTELGIRRKPQLRLALGYRDENRRGAPVKTDYFIPKGNDAAVAKFQRTYGDKPKAIDIRLPGSLGGFLDIRHVAFAGGQHGDGGVLKAIGKINFALEGKLGGPDLLTVFNVGKGADDKPMLVVDEVEISGVDDPAAQALGVQLQTSVTFGIPDVLGFGGICEIRSRGRETTDTLWATAVDIYGQLGAQASIVLRPKLILKPSKMRTPSGSMTDVWVLDLYVPESLDEVLGRMREYRELTGPAASALYGPRALAEGSPAAVPVMESRAGVSTDGPETPAPEAGVAGGSPGAATPAPTPEPEPQGEPEPEPGDDVPLEGDLVDDAADAADMAAARAAADAFVPPSGQYAAGGTKGPKTLSEILALGDEGRLWLRWALRNVQTGDEYLSAIWTFAQFNAPDLYQQVRAEKEAQQ